MYPLNDIRDTVLTFVTAQGMLKQVQGLEFDVAKRTTAATKLLEEDSVLEIHAAAENAHIVLATEEGYFLRFAVSEIPLKKKGAVGVRGIKLGPKDSVRQVYWLEGDKNPEVLYKEKKVYINKLRIGSRDTRGTKARS